MADFPTSGRGSSPDGAGLDRLLETEALLSARLAQAEADTAGLVAEARAAAAERETRYQSELEAAIGAAAARVTADGETAVARIRADAAARAAQFRSLGASRIERLAAAVAGRVLPLPGDAS